MGWGRTSDWREGGIKHEFKEIDIDINQFMENDIDMSVCYPNFLWSGCVLGKGCCSKWGEGGVG